MEAQGHVNDSTPLFKAAATRFGNRTQEVNRELFRVQDQDSSRYEIYNFNSTELDVSVSALTILLYSNQNEAPCSIPSPHHRR
jgi:hypothetical protein